ncbi:MFS transporter [Streptomyces bathyalis]|uniref:MFS transporter n=1 Tax=Streptomyces bathyalis TaxID=2710756 RepID=A0A7T1WU37_9ACTN|nr:MFS transporter [Streptomyces bathyalis]QPP07480.1 MFS transporter [Streptomyces bathyalis]
MVTAPPRQERRPRRPLAPWALTVCVLGGQVMATLDTSIVNVAGPSVQRDLRLSGADLQLAVYSYVLAYAVGLIIGARLGGRHGYGRVFAWAVVLFTVSSLACGLAVSPSMLVAARTVQGLGAALLVPQVLSLLQITFEGEKRRRALSLYGMVLAIGVAAGQVLGGLLVGADLFGMEWRPVFLVNVPVGLAVLAWSAGRLPQGPASGERRLDLPGAAVLAGGVLMLVVPLTFGAGAGWPWWCWPSLAAGALALMLFGMYEARLARTGREPLIDPALLSPPEVRAGLVGIFTMMSCFGGLLFTTALHLQTVLLYSPLRSGLTFAAYSAGFATASLTWSRLPSAWHPRVPGASFAAMALATGLLSLAVAGQGWPWQATALLVMAGAGHGAGFGALMQRTAGSVRTEHAADVSGVVATVIQLSIVSGIAAAGTLYLWSTSAATQLPPMSLTFLSVAAVLTVVGTAVPVFTAHRRRGSAGPRA